MEYQVKLFDEGLEYQTEFPETKAYYNGEEYVYFVKKPVFVKLRKTSMHMPLTNYKSDKIVKKIIKEYFSTKVSEEEINDFLKNDFMDFWLDELQGEIDKKIDYCLFNIGGYPNFSQADPRPRLKPRKNECVFSLDPIGLEEFIEIVDCGTMWGFISKEDLKNGKFENMFVDYDYC